MHERGRWVIVVGAVLLAACGGGGESVSSGSPAAAGRPDELTSVDVPVPTKHEVNPELFDENGCTYVVEPTKEDPKPDPELRCPGGVGGGPVDEEVESGPPAAQEIDVVGARGYWGPLFAVAVPLSGPNFGAYVLERSTHLAGGANGGTDILGLVRNESTEVMGAVSVEALLLSENGEEIERVSGMAAVDFLRPGEPAPFVLTATTAADRIHRIEWTANAAASSAKPVSREAVVNVLNQHPYGKREPLGDRYLTDYGETELGADHPYILEGRLFVNGDASLGRIRMTAAWISESGQVIAVTTMPATQPGSRSVEADRLDQDTAADFYIIEDDEKLGPLLTTSTVMVWASGVQ